MMNRMSLFTEGKKHLHIDRKWVKPLKEVGKGIKLSMWLTAELLPIILPIDMGDWVVIRFVVIAPFHHYKLHNPARKILPI